MMAVFQLYSYWAQMRSYLDDQDSNCFVVYQGHHGDNGAHQADLIFPSPAFNEQNGLYVNSEGRVQESVRATFPVGRSKRRLENYINDC